MKVARVKAGICGFVTEIVASSQNGRQVDLVFRTQCPNLKPMEEELTQVDAYAECFAKVGDSPVYHLARKFCKHAACPVPSAIIKEIEIAAKLALPADVTFEFEDDAE
ncbi:Hypothetical protein DEACI_1436 [Acididesulfobacillus acetoxydans]|uniref:Uncharacterized protein n=1 Tax=Acididesulfobacillus acetoxydans TaxID=1561005 RepID=A0A8S0VWE7_9FIRM|nr:hypothetical protein [Acididesulfobacillus acetoxydans]CAA7600783.1 Hypothetical protein DEACI_1436 [Acididesulfobacillus acetoxydans]CEJ08631.1 Hypothetical protein DEACI_3110 [Acididesulfobacillus acetoxydans]